ncbi:hypothetical protein IAU60_002054 [Kwoniella sp. DSM 27419]
MPPASRFGASKYRNAVPYIPPREEFYRSSLPPFSSASSTSSNVSTFSSEIKTSREWIVTVSQAGDMSYRGYEGEAGVIKVGSGGGVGDWDLSRLEDGLAAIGGLDGGVSVYALPALSATPTTPSLVGFIPASSSPITSLLFHPTTPSLILASTAAKPLTIYDVSTTPFSPAIDLKATEPKGIWSAAWSSDGRRIAVFGKSGNLAIYDPRSSPEPIATKSFSFTVQALKPARVAWCGSDIFLSSFSKTRNRQYALISTEPSLQTKFSQSLDTSPGVLIPLVDEKRDIVYAAGRGDMTLRQIEMSGPQGYQETLHPLPYAIASTGLAHKHPTALDVMSAEIARVMLPVVDKDGDAILPLGVRVPRRQLIDYHEDLYPDVVGTVPEQNAREWLDGSDRSPLPFTMDPARRGSWEGRVRQWTEENRGRVTSAPSAGDARRGDESTSTEAKLQSSELDKGALRETPAQSAPLPSQPASLATAEPVPECETAPAKTDDSVPSARADLPPLQDAETYSSTTYKARIASEYLAAQVSEHKRAGRTGPLMVGLQGPQGCGKTTLCDSLLAYLREKKDLSAAVLSLDDLYKTHAELVDIAQQHPENALLAGRGPPGTHDVKLAQATIEKVKQINGAPGRTVNLPVFDKSLCGGEGDRSSSTVKITGPLDVFILEGWSMGFGALSDEALKAKYEQAKPSPASPETSHTYYPLHSLRSLEELNTYLQELASAIYPSFEAFIQVEPVSYDYVFEWRLEQEHAMKAKNGGKGMTDEQVHKFVERYMPGYELWKEGIWAKGTGWEGKGLRIKYGKARDVMEVVQPRGDGAPSVDGEAGTAMPGKVEQLDGASEAQVRPVEREMKAAVGETPVNEVTPFPAPPAAPASADGTKVEDPKAAPTANDLPKAAASAVPSGSASKNTSPSARFNPGWSRKFLAGKSPLIPSYDSVPSLSSLHQDSRVLKANATLAFFPIQGTGGRLLVHPLARKGRMPTGGRGYLSTGIEIVDFDVELARDDGGASRVAVAGEDGVVRVWSIGIDGVEGVGPEPNQVLKGKGIDKIAQLGFHPTAKDLLVGLTNDHGKASLRFWDLSTGQEAKQVELGADGAFNMAFSIDGQRVAIATKDSRLIVLDPRDPSSAISGKAHDSPRSFQMTWVDDSHIISVGFARGSQRKINLYQVPSSSTEGELKVISSVTIDVSPSVLFPVYDTDTSILYIWGKGERVIQAYEVHTEPGAREPIAKLPSYTAGSPQVGVAFLPKRMVDVKKVEVARSLRLTARTMEEVTFSIPRNKPDFFQDDIYQSTVDVESAVVSAADWLAGKNVPPGRISLQPEGMMPLSQAPKNDSAATKKFVPAANVMSEEEKKRKEMDELFAKAKMDESSDEEEEKRGIDPPDDDW